jgi:prepilin peptidase CpaA
MNVVQFHVGVFVFALAITGAAAVTDARTGRIPNGFAVTLLGVVSLGDLVWGETGAFLRSVSGLVVCGAVPLFLFSRDAMGGGDVKLLAALGAALGWARGLEVQLAAYVVAAVYAMVMLVRRGELKRTLASAVSLVVPRRGTVPPPSNADAPTVRLGVFILLGCLFAMTRSVLEAS